MVNPKTTAGLTGIERVDAAGWPYHGVTRARYSGGALVSRGLEGHSWALPAAAPMQVLQHYPMRMRGMQAEGSQWDYYFLYGIAGTLGDLGYGINPGIFSSTGAADQVLGIPLKINGKILNIAVFQSKTAGQLTLYDMRSGQYKQVSYPFSTAPDIRIGLYDASGGERVVTLAQLVALTGQYFVLQARVLDFYENKALISIEPTGYCESLAAIESTPDSRYVAGYIPEHGYVSLCILELTVTDSSIESASITAAYSTSACAGIISRSSPTNTSSSFSWHLEQRDAVLDAWYGVGGVMQALRGTFARTFSTVKQLYSDESVRQWSVDAATDVTVGGVRQQYRIEARYQTFYEAGQNNLSQKVWRNNTLINEEIGTIYTPVWFHGTPDYRAPWAGSETRYMHQGMYLGTDIRWHSTASIYRNNGTATSVLYGVYEPIRFSSSDTIIKSVDTAGVVGRNTASIAQFTDTVLPNDPRYDRDDGNLSHLNGYVGSRLRGIINPITLEYGLESLQYPISYVNFR